MVSTKNGWFSRSMFIDQRVIYYIYIYTYIYIHAMCDHIFHHHSAANTAAHINPYGSVLKMLVSHNFLHTCLNSALEKSKGVWGSHIVMNRPKKHSIFITLSQHLWLAIPTKRLSSSSSSSSSWDHPSVEDADVRKRFQRTCFWFAKRIGHGLVRNSNQSSTIYCSSQFH